MIDELRGMSARELVRNARDQFVERGCISADTAKALRHLGYDVPMMEAVWLALED
jgi:hypothetical protein